VGGERSRQRRPGREAERGVRGDGGRLVGAEASRGDGRQLGRDRDGGDEQRAVRAEVDARPAGALPDEDALQGPGRRRRGRHLDGGQPRRPSLPRPEPVQPPQAAGRGGAEHDHERRRPGSDEATHDAGRDGPPDERHGQHVGAAERDGRRHRPLDPDVRAPHGADHAHRFAEAQREHVVGGEGDVDRRPGLAERELGQHAVPDEGAERERERERRQREQRAGRSPDGFACRGRQRGAVDVGADEDDRRGHGGDPDRPGAAPRAGRSCRGVHAVR
jgi:hypothetical protein